MLENVTVIPEIVIGQQKDAVGGDIGAGGGGCLVTWINPILDWARALKLRNVFRPVFCATSHDLPQTTGVVDGSLNTFSFLSIHSKGGPFPIFDKSDAHSD